jgi:3-isopropylmalate/(R)-2-methylmalate dehydratase small subunit
VNRDPFTTVTGTAAWLPNPNVDTDVIIRIDRLTALARGELGRYCFESLRYGPDGSDIPDFVMNLPTFKAAPFLLAGENFGCGSSREGAVWALQELGIRCVIAPSFGDIFYSNCFQNGVLPIRLPLADVHTIGASCLGGAPLTVDLERLLLEPPMRPPMAFTVDVQRREGLLTGIDDVDRTLHDDDAIRAWQHDDRTARPWVWSI